MGVVSFGRLGGAQRIDEPRRYDESRPTLVYDDDCGLCAQTVEFAARHGEFEIVGFSELAGEQRARLPEEYETCSHLLTDEGVHSCGASAEETLARLDHPVALPARAFRRLPSRKPVRERLYRLVADNRSQFGRLF